MTPADRALILDQLATTAGTFTLGPVDLHIDPGSVLVVLGPSGAGKTLLLDTIAGFRAPTTGRVLLTGRDITALPPERRRIGLVFQHAALFPHLSVRDNIRFGPHAQGHTRTERADDLLAQFGLEMLADRRPRSLSGGERQRVALARALAANPDLLLLDEPLSALDQPAREELRSLLSDLLSALHIPAVHVTHDRDEALTLADNIAVIVDGHLRQTAPAHHIAAHPADPDVARLLGWIHLADGRLDRNTIRLGDLHLPAASGLPASKTVSVFYRPEAVELTPSRTPAATPATVTRTIQRLVPTTPLSRVQISGEPPVTALILHRDLARLGLRPGQEITVGLPADSLSTFPTLTPSDTSARSATVNTVSDMSATQNPHDHRP